MNGNGKFAVAAATAFAVIASLGSSVAFARDRKRDDPDHIRTVTVTVESKDSSSKVDPADFAIYKGDTKQQILDVKGPEEAPVNVAVLIQDGLDQGVGHELDTIKDFIGGLPPGSNVMVGYLRSTGLTVAKPFSTDLGAAAKAVRLPISSDTEGSAPFLGLKEALDGFGSLKGRNQVVMITNGLELNRDFASAAPQNNLDLDRVIGKAQELGIPVWGIFANSAGRLGHARLAIFYGQGSLGRLASETGGRAFFAGDGFVTFNHAFDSIAEGIQNQYLIAYQGSGKGDLDVTVESSKLKVLHSK